MSFKSNDLTLATPKLQAFWPKLKETAKNELGIEIVLTNVARDIMVQAAFYAQGREPLYKVNLKRQLAGLPSIGDKENKNPITWTMKSKHIIDRHNQTAADDYSHAIDFAVIGPGGAINWSVKADTNHDNKSDYIQVGQLIQRLDPTIIWGGKWKTPDYPHLQDIA
jgi:hypothetical protein